jgi:hypothetical protein
VFVAVRWDGEVSGDGDTAVGWKIEVKIGLMNA